MSRSCRHCGRPSLRNVAAATLPLAAIVERRVLGRSVPAFVGTSPRPAPSRTRTLRPSTRGRCDRDRPPSIVERVDEELREARARSFRRRFSSPSRWCAPARRPSEESAPLELAVLTNTTRSTCSVPSSRAKSSAVRSGPGRLNVATLPSKLPWPMSSTKTSSSDRAFAARSAERLLIPSLRRRALQSARDRPRAFPPDTMMLPSGNPVLLLRRVDEARRQLMEELRVLLVAGEPVMTSRCVSCAKAEVAANDRSQHATRTFLSSRGAPPPLAAD